MQLNLKDAETNVMVARLAALTRTNKTVAVREAVRARLAEVEAAREADISRRLAEVQALTKAFVDRLPKPLPTQAELDDWMYDENGLPR